MAKYREAPCAYYVCKGECMKGRKNAEQTGRCQTCSKYRPRKGYKSVGNAKYKKLKNSYID